MIIKRMLVMFIIQRGGPWFEEYKDVDYSQDWFQNYKECMLIG